MSYLANGRVRESIDPAARPRCFTWSADGADLLSIHAQLCTTTLAATDAANRLVRIEYDVDARHLPVRVTDAAGQVSTFAYNIRGQVLRATRPDGKATDYIYTSPSTAVSGAPGGLDVREGLLSQVRFPVIVGATPAPPLSTTSIVYNGHELAAEVTTGDGVARTFTYDDLDRVTSITAPGSRVQYFDYGIRDANGAGTGNPGLEATRVTQPNSDTLTLSYDALHRLIRSANGASDVVRYQYNRAGSGSFDLIQMLRGSGNMDVLARWSVPLTNPSSSGRVEAPDSAFQQVASSLARVAPATIGIAESWSRDVAGRVTGRSDGTNQWSVLYKANGLIDQLCESATCTTATPRILLQYEGELPTSDPAHAFKRLNLVQRVASSGLIDYTRSYSFHPIGSSGALNVAVMTEQENQANSAESLWYSYDQIGRTTGISFSSPGEGLTLRYDDNDRLDYVTSSAAPGQNLVRYLYPPGQAAARPNAAQMPLYGCEANFSYHAADHDFRPMQRQLVRTLTGSVLSLFNLQFDLRDRIRQETNNATQRTYTYDNNGRPMWMDDYNSASGSYLNRDSYYDNAGNSTGQMYFGPSGTTYSESMSFDLVDRFFSRTRSAGAAVYPAHDPRGRVVNDGDFFYAWDRDDRMTQVTRIADGKIWRFRYDGTGRLRRFEEGGMWHRLTWVNGQPGREFVGTTESAQQTLRRTYNFDGFTEGGVRYLYDRDVRGSVRALVSNGQVSHAWTYEPWGQRNDAGGSNSALDSRVGFAGYVYHPETGLYFTPARVYRPELRRWLSRDPLGERATVDGNNVYSYTANDPANRVDPSGLDPSWAAHFWEMVWGNLIPILNPNIWGGMIGFASPSSYAIGPMQYYDDNPITGPFTPDITLGEHVCSRRHASADVREHEDAHEVQFRYLGSFYLPAHGLAMLSSAAVSAFYGHPHADRWHEFNPLEWGPMRAGLGRPAVPFGGRPW